MTSAEPAPGSMTAGWPVIAAGLAILMIVPGLLLYAFVLMVVPWAEAFGAPRSLVLSTSLALGTVSAVIGPFIGHLLDTFPIRRIMLGGAALLVIGLLALAAAQNIWQVIAIYAVILAAASQINGALAVQTLMARRFTERRGVLLTIASVGPSLGGLVMPPVVAVLLTHYDWRQTLAILAAGVALLLPLVIIAATRGAPVGRLAEKGGATGGDSVAYVLKSFPFWGVALGVTLLLMGVMGLQHNLAAYAHDIGIDIGRASLLISAYSGAAIVSKLGWAILTEKLDHTWLLTLIAALLGAGVVLMWQAQGFALLIAGAAALGAANGGFQPVMSVSLLKLYGAAAFGRTLGLGMSVNRLGTLGPVLIGLVYDRTGAYGWAFAAIVPLIALALTLAWLSGAAARGMRPASGG